MTVSICCGRGIHFAIADRPMLTADPTPEPIDDGAAHDHQDVERQREQAIFR